MALASFTHAVWDLSHEEANKAWFVGNEDTIYSNVLSEFNLRVLAHDRAEAELIAKVFRLESQTLHEQLDFSKDRIIVTPFPPPNVRGKRAQEIQRHAEYMLKKGAPIDPPCYHAEVEEIEADENRGDASLLEYTRLLATKLVDEGIEFETLEKLHIRQDDFEFLQYARSFMAIYKHRLEKQICLTPRAIKAGFLGLSPSDDDDDDDDD